MREKASKIEEGVVTPVCYYVVVEPEVVDDVTSGGIILPSSAVDQMQVQREKGTIVSMGPTAFDMDKWGDVKPKVGDKVMFTKHAGTVFQDKANRKKYRIMDDEYICAIFREE